MEGGNTGDKDVDDTEDDEEGCVDEKYLVGEDVHLLGCEMICLVTICRRAVPAGDEETDYGGEE